MRLAYASAAVAALSTLAACGDAPAPRAASWPTAPAGQPAAPLARLRGTVDVAAGTLTFEPVPASDGPALSAGTPNAAVYGAQGSTVRIYNSAVVTSAPVAGKKTYTGNVGIRNLLAYRVGDEQGAAAPADTMGIYVFVSSGPVVVSTSSACPACTVTVKNAHGTMSFTAPNQPYWFWQELLNAANSGSDSTRVRQPWVFEADTQVTRFSFDVLVSAAWVAPNESVWKVQYPGDSLPDTQTEPRWRIYTSAGSTAAASGGTLVLKGTSATDSLFYYRNDSVQTLTDALLEARFRLDNGGFHGKPQAGLIIDDNIKFIGLFVSDSSNSAGRAQIGFIRSSAGGGYLAGGPIDTVAVKNFHTYQIRKYKADSVVVYIEGARRMSILYSLLPTSRSLTGPSSFMFGTRPPGGGNTSTWGYALYQIGQATP